MPKATIERANHFIKAMNAVLVIIILGLALVIVPALF